MEFDVLRIVGQVAGIGGIALGVVLLLFREVIRKKIFPNLTKQQAYRLLRLLLVLVWCLALAGIAAWVVVEVNRDGDQPSGASEVQPPVGTAPWVEFSDYDFELALGSGGSTVESAEWAMPISRESIEIPVEDFPTYKLVFDLTNRALSDLHVIRVDIRALNWSPLENVIGYYDDYGYFNITSDTVAVEDGDVTNGEVAAGGGGALEEPARFTVAVNDEIGTYSARPVTDEKAVLKSGELDVFSVAVTAPRPGRYTLQFIVHYSIGGETGVLELEPLPDILFFDPDAIPHLDR